MNNTDNYRTENSFTSSWRICVAFGILALSGCASTQHKSAESSESMDRIIQNRYSFVLPYETGWSTKGRNHMNIALTKDGQDNDETFSIQVVQFKLPNFKTTAELIRRLKTIQSKNVKPPRYEIKKHTLIAYPKKGKHCIRSHRIVEDNGADNNPEKSAIMITSSLTITCPHPDNKDIGINMSYSHHYRSTYTRGKLMEKPSKIIDRKFIKKAEKFLDSLKFI